MWIYLLALIYNNFLSFLFICVLETGQAVCFSGNLLHGGDAVLSGCRYIIAAFFVLYEVGNFEDEIDNNDIPEQNEDAAVRKKFKIDIDQPNEFSFGFLL